jgi:hypothetical protein
LEKEEELPAGEKKEAGVDEEKKCNEGCTHEH